MCGSSLSFASQANTDAMAWVRLWCNKRGSLEMCQMATTGTMCTPVGSEHEHGTTINYRDALKGGPQVV